MARSTPKPLAYFATTHTEHGHKFTTITVYEAPRVRSILDALASCDDLSNWTDAAQAERYRERYTAAQTAGVTHMVDTAGAARVELKFLHHGGGFCEPRIGLNTRAYELHRDYALLRRIERRFRRTRAPFGSIVPVALMAALGKALRMHDSGGLELCEFIAYSAGGQ